MLRNKDIFSQIFCVFFVKSGTSGTTLVFNVEFYLSLQICELIFSVIAIKPTLNYAITHI